MEIPFWVEYTEGYTLEELKISYSIYSLTLTSVAVTCGRNQQLEIVSSAWLQSERAIISFFFAISWTLSP